MTKEHISREAAINALSHGDGCGHVCKHSIERIPAANVSPVKHGTWTWDRRVEAYRCSSCQLHNADRAAYCPNCGAKMNGGQDDV